MLKEVANFTVPGTPKPKERPRHNSKTGHTYTPTATLDAESKVLWCWRASRPASRTPIARGTDLRIEIDAYLPDRRGRDWDNIGKLVADALNKHAYQDDAQIKEAEVKMFYDKANPRTEVRLYTLEPA